METNEPIDHGMNEGLSLSSQNRDDLQGTAKWSGFLAILGFIGVGIMVILALFIGTFLSTMGAPAEALPIPPIALTFLYLIIAAIYFLPILYLYRFSSQIKQALRGGSPESLTSALGNLKAHYKFIGILAAIVAGLYAIGILISLIFGATAFAGGGF